MLSQLVLLVLLVLPVLLFVRPLPVMKRTADGGATSCWHPGLICTVITITTLPAPPVIVVVPLPVMAATIVMPLRIVIRAAPRPIHDG